MATDGDVAQKRHAFEEYLVTTHWPAKNITCGEVNSDFETATYAMPRTRQNVEDAVIRKLAAIEPYDVARERRCIPLLQRPAAELEVLAAGHRG